MNDLSIRIQNALAQAINSLKGQTHFGYADLYIGHMGRQVNTAMTGFIHLHKLNCPDAARMLVRPSLEAAIKISALMTESEIIYRLAFGEMQDSKKWFKATKGPNSPAEQNLDAGWAKFSSNYRTDFPTHQVMDAGLSMEAIAIKANNPDFYQVYYRLYCRFTHGSLEAVSGGLEIDYKTDDFAMKACSLIALKAVVFLGGECEDFTSLERDVEDEVNARNS